MADKQVGLSEGNRINMGREANFSELREAIRQGQAKIAQGLKTGQMRSDRDKKPDQPVMRLDIARESLGKKTNLTAQSSVFDAPKKPAFQVKMPKPKMPRLPKLGSLPKIRVSLPRLPQVPMGTVIAVLRGMAMVVAVAIVVLIIFWIGKSLLTGGPTQPITKTPSVEPPRPAETRPIAQPPVTAPAATPRETPAVPATPPPAPPKPPVAAVPPRTGDNAIVIQYIIASREAELKPVMEFFAKNGIPTEIIRIGNGSYLVTQGRFENPNRIGSDGHAMLQKIRAIGKRYPAETGDRQFGAAPFQDAYGKLMQ